MGVLVKQVDSMFFLFMFTLMRAQGKCIQQVMINNENHEAGCLIWFVAPGNINERITVHLQCSTTTAEHK